MKVSLTTKQRKVIKKAALIQLESLRSILDGECEQDIELYCIQREVARKKLMELVTRNIEAFTLVYNHPEYFLNLPPTHLSTLIHILNTSIKHRKIARMQIWRKMVVFEQFEFNPN